jgi:molybdate transport system substrate-binding protein
VTWRDAANVVTILVTVMACASSGSMPTPTAAGTTGQAAATAIVELTMYGAASLRDALAEIERAYEAAVPGTTLTIGTDASSTLRAQIDQGAPADVFLSADLSNPRGLVEAGLADGDAVPFAGNLLTIIVPSDNPAGIESPADLARPGVKVVAAGDGVPISTYARQVIAKLARVPGYPTEFTSGYAANIVSKETDVKAVVAKIVLGEADAAIVYATDARAAADVVSTVEIPAATNVPATYAGVVVRDTPRPNEARAFLTWLAGPEGAAILGTFGFRRPVSR